MIGFITVLAGKLAAVSSVLIIMYILLNVNKGERRQYI